MRESQPSGPPPAGPKMAIACCAALKESQRVRKAAARLGERKPKPHELAEAHDVGWAVHKRRVHHQALLPVYNDVVDFSGIVKHNTPCRQKKSFRLLILQR